MAVPTIPSAISLGHIRVEFYSAGSNTNITFNSYYAGGTNVASGTTNATSVAIPSSGQIAFSNFSGATATEIKINAILCYAADLFSPYSATAYCVYRTAGDVDTNSTSNAFLWASPPGSFTASDYKVRLSVVSTTGGASLNYGGTSGTYYAMTTTRQWGYTRTSFGTGTVTCNACIAYVSNSTIIACNSHSFNVTNGDL